MTCFYSLQSLCLHQTIFRGLKYICLVHGLRISNLVSISTVMIASLLSIPKYVDINQFVVSTVFAITKIDNRKITPRLQNKY